MYNKEGNVIKSGYLSVGDGHKIYYEQWGNKTAKPVFYLHGGPGGGFSDSHKYNFNPKKHHVIFFDQRGAGKSKPFASTKANTTQHLIEDIEKLRKLFKFEKISLNGRSWGSALALAYTIAYPDRVNKMLIGGVYFGTRFENDYISAGYVRYTYPEAWERFINLVPNEFRKSGMSITQYYSDKMFDKNKKVAKKYADEWTLWEVTTLSISYDQAKVETDVFKEENLALARLETHYFLNDCFMPENHVLGNIDKIKHIPCYVVQGRFDNCTPPSTAYELSKAYGDKLTLQWVNAGHRRSDPEIQVAERAAINSFLYNI